MISHSLYEKLFVFYRLTVSDTSIEAIFKEAIGHKEITENPDPKTITHDKSCFKRFITNEFAMRDIRDITVDDLKKYSQNLVKNNEITDKAFKKYKGVLNLIFGYALEKQIISTNPVAAIKNKVYLKSCDTRKAASKTKIFSPEEIEKIKERIRLYMTYDRYNDGYYINGYAMLFAIETGMRVAELCALKNSDIHDGLIHIHSQQTYEKNPNGKGKLYKLSSTTKNERGISQDGRFFPVTNAIQALLDELNGLKAKLGIESEYVFCHENGDWIKSDAYETSLRRLCQSLELQVTNNHAFRMSLNSNVFIPKGLPVTERARLLGHSVETNLRYYSYAGKDNLDDIRDLLNS